MIERKDTGTDPEVFLPSFLLLYPIKFKVRQVRLEKLFDPDSFMLHTFFVKLYLHILALANFKLSKLTAQNVQVDLRIKLNSENKNVREILSKVLKILADLFFRNG